MALQLVPGYETTVTEGNSGAVVTFENNRSILQQAIYNKYRNPFRILNHNLSGLKRLGEEDFRDRLVDTVEELQLAFEDERSATMAPSEAQDSQLPQHGATCPLMGGQYLEVISANTYDQLGNLSYVPLVFSHGLGRVPSGCINIYDTSFTYKICVDGDVSLGASPATTTEVTIVPFVEPNKRTFVVLF